MSDNPINYNIGSGQPIGLEDFTQGAALGQGLRMGAEAAKTAQQARGLEAQKAAAQQAMMQELAAESRRPGGPNSESVAALMVRYPQMAENLKRSMDVLAPAEKRERLGQLSSIVAAAKSGNVNLAIDLLKRNATAYRNAGREKDAQAMEDNARLLEESPEDTMFTLESALAANDPEKYMETVKGMGTLGADVAKAASEAVKSAKEAEFKAGEVKFQEQQQMAALKYTTAQTNRLYAQTKNDAARLALDRDRLVAENLARKAELQAKAGDLPEAVRKDADAAVNDGTKAKLQAETAENLSKKFREYSKNLTSSSGLRAKGGELLAGWAGMEDDVSAMRKQYEALVADRVVTNLPPGAASDRDIELIKGGFPEGTGNPTKTADFLDAMANVQRATEAQKRTESDYLYMNKSLSPARADIVVNGVTIPAGTSFADASALVQSQRKAAADFASIPQRRAAAATF
jgi:hypothetical protein